MTAHDIEKALEVWTLQNLLNLSILLGLLATALALSGGYFRTLEKHLTLRVSQEAWRLGNVVMVDILLGAVVLIGYVVLNPDIMADIKMGVPFCPIATVLFAVALVLRLFYGGQDPASPNHLRSLKLMVAACVANVIGFTFVMEAASDEFLAHHPSGFWTFVKTQFRSNADPAGLDLAWITYNICFPILVAIAIWGVWAGLRNLSSSGRE